MDQYRLLNAIRINIYVDDPAPVYKYCSALMSTYRHDTLMAFGFNPFQ